MAEQVFQLAFQFIDQEPRAAARLLETSEVASVLPFLSNTPAPMVVKMLQEMQADYAAKILSATDLDTAQLWMRDLHSRVLSLFFRHMDASKQQELLNSLTLKKKAACQLLLSFREDMVGAIVETDIITFPTDMSATDALRRLKQRQFREERIAIAIDHERKLVGEVSLSQLLQAGKNTTLGDIQQACAAVISGRSSIQSAINHPVWKKRDSAVVINRQREVIGILWFSQLRRALTTTVTNREPGTTTLQHSALDLLQAHGDSMRALLDVLFKVSA